MMKLSAVLTASLLLAAPLTGAQAQSSNDYAGIARYGNPMYAVTITNLTRGSSFTPILVASHRPGVEWMELGTEASTELAAMAEGGDTAPLEAALLDSGQVVGTGHSQGLLGPGQSVTVEVPAGNANRISLAAMILPTNDGFIALNGVEVPRAGSQTFSVPGYDAGSEPNDELCASIPGPHVRRRGRLAQCRRRRFRAYSCRDSRHRRSEAPPLTIGATPWRRS